jgi:hypothetical protein
MRIGIPSGFGWCWTGAAGWDTECLRGPWGDGLGKGDWEGWGGEDVNGLFRHETHLRCTHVAPETTCDVVSLGDSVERCLAHTGRCNGRWDRGQLAMTQDARNDCLLGDGSNDPE